jgi:hypothetical protein
MAYSRRDDWFKNPLGLALAGAQLYVCTQPASTGSVPPSPLATIYSSSAGGTPITQPVIADGFGHTFFYGDQSQLYTLVWVYSGAIAGVLIDQALASVGAIRIEVNGTPTAVQNIANFIAGTYMEITSDNAGGITFTNTPPPISEIHKWSPNGNAYNENEDTGIGLSISPTTYLGASIRPANPYYGGRNMASFDWPTGGINGDGDDGQGVFYEEAMIGSLGYNFAAINLQTLNHWEARVATSLPLLNGWQATLPVTQGMMLLQAGNYYSQLAGTTTTCITGSSLPSFNTTPGQTTSDGGASWFCMGGSSSSGIQPYGNPGIFIGIADYVGSNIGGGGIAGDIFRFADPAGNAHGSGGQPAFNFVGFRYIPNVLLNTGANAFLSAPQAGGDNGVYAIYMGGLSFTPTVTPTTFAIDNAGVDHLFAIDRVGTTYIFSIDGTVVGSIVSQGTYTRSFFSAIGTPGSGFGVNVSLGHQPPRSTRLGLGALVYDSNAFVWQVVVAGVTGSGSVSFSGAAVPGTQQPDGGVTWQCVNNDAGSALQAGGFGVNEITWWD